MHTNTRKILMLPLVLCTRGIIQYFTRVGVHWDHHSSAFHSALSSTLQHYYNGLGFLISNTMKRSNLIFWRDILFKWFYQYFSKQWSQNDDSTFPIISYSILFTKWKPWPFSKVGEVKWPKGIHRFWRNRPGFILDDLERKRNYYGSLKNACERIINQFCLQRCQKKHWNDIFLWKRY